MASLQVIKGPHVGAVFELTTSESVMGRYPFCDVVLPSHTISRQHARVVQAGDQFFIEDMNSLNGTFVNGDRVRGRVLLKDQDRIRLYETLLLFHLKDIPAAQKPDEAPPADIAHTAPYLPPSVAAPELEEDASGERVVAVVSALELRSGVCGGEQGEDQLRAIVLRMRATGQQHHLAPLLDQILDALLDLFPNAERGHLLLVEQPGGRLELKASKNRQEGAQTQMTMGPIRQSLAKRVIARGEAVLSAEDEEEDSVLAAGTPSSLCAPLLGPSRTPLGILHLDSIPGAPSFNENDLNALVSIGMIAGQAIEIAQLLGDESVADQLQPAAPRQVSKKI